MKLIEGKTIAQAFPARCDSNGVWWFAAGAGRMDGWTASPEYADESYQCTTCFGHPSRCTCCTFNGEPLISTTTVSLTHEGVHVTTTELTAEPRQYARYSEYANFPLPPFPEAVNVEQDGFKRYKLPHPTTGRLTAYTRCTTIAETMPNYFTLNRWKERIKVQRVLECLDQAKAGYDYAQQLEKALRAAIEKGNGKELNAAIDEIDNVYGGAEARELGGAVHDWIAELDMGRVLMRQIPPMFQPYAKAYQDAMARAGLIAIPEYTERIILNRKGAETIAGRLDGIARCVETGELVVIDRKTSKTLDFSVLEYGTQLAGYAYADLMLLEDRSGWIEFPEVNLEQAYLVHIPSDQPEQSQVVPFALWPGGEAMIAAYEVREQRRKVEAKFLGGTYPIPSERSLRYVAARQALQSLEVADQASAILQEYEDVLDDELMSFGAQCFELLNTEEDQ